MARSTIAITIAALLLAAAFSVDAAAPAFDAPPPGTLCNRSCWKGNNLFNIKAALFKLCKAKCVITQTNETKRGSGKSGPPKFGRCNTYIVYRFKTNAELKAFQLCQSKQTLYLNQVVNKNFKQILTSPPKYSAYC